MPGFLESFSVYILNDPDGRILIPTWKRSMSENLMKTSQGFFIGTMYVPYLLSVYITH